MDTLESPDKRLSVEVVDLDPGGTVYELRWGGILLKFSFGCGCWGVRRVLQRTFRESTMISCFPVATRPSTISWATSIVMLSVRSECARALRVDSRPGPAMAILTILKKGGNDQL